MKKVESNVITKYETDLWKEVSELVTDLDRNKNDIKITYTARSGKFDVVIRSEKED
ncbi:MAG: hypothetical protein J6Y02_06570 [Pseudobutyrivibrio sp.]|nr:hypothetical protein [Pseudobutyrivibrio sp.]